MDEATPSTHSTSTPYPRSPAPGLTLAEVRAAFSDCDKYPPILSLKQAAELSHYKPSTLKRLVSEGRFRGAVKRKRPLLFWRDKFILELWNQK